jgi:hypothetical protein
MRNIRRLLTTVMLVASFATASARADIVTEWNEKAADIVTAAPLRGAPGYRVMAMVQVAVLDAVDTITKRAAAERAKAGSLPAASMDAAVAAATRGVLSRLAPSQQSDIDAAYRAALAGIPDGPAKSAGVTVGEDAARRVLDARLHDGADATVAYRPRTTPGVYVPTALPVVAQWPQRKPWVLTRGNQFRPGPPPELGSEQWARDYNETKSMGAKTSAARSAEQTDIAQFWEATVPAIYFPIVRSIANVEGRDVVRNARLLAAAAEAMDDALIGIFDAKYHYGFWRPLTAIRNGDHDGNDATEQDPSWQPFVETPMHPEYPCAHCGVAAAVGAVLKAEVGSGSMPELRSTSPTAPGVVRTWASVDEFVREVADARICDGVHFRSSTVAGEELGRSVGELVAAKRLK